MILSFASALAGHLWQSTLFAALAGVLTLVLKKNRAQERYWIWFIASIKFLIPFSWLASIGRHVGWTFALPRASQYDWLLDATMYSPATSATGAASPLPSSSLAMNMAMNMAISITMIILLALWAVGFAVILRSWCAAWARVTSALRTAVKSRGQEYQMLLRLRQLTRVTTTVDLVYSPSILEPSVFGILRPVLLLPTGLRDYLNPEHLEAILAHELCHVRRRDNLLACLPMLVQALFWFHPLVSWLGARLVEERERACDEEVVQLGSEPRVYAESILRVCKFCVTSALPCVSGVTGADLKKRIETIMSHGFGQSLNAGRKLLLAAAALAAIALPLIAGMLGAPRLRAQSPDATERPKFDIATIKPSEPGTNVMVSFAPGGRLEIKHATLRFLLKIAYDIGDQQIEGGPAWLGSKRFDVEAKPDTPLAADPRSMTEDQRRLFREQVRLRLQSLLADRFQLKIRTESRDLPIFALVVAKGGLKIKPAEDDTRPGIRGGRGELNATGVTMEMFAHFLSEQAGRPVIDKSGLKGAFNFELKWTPDPGQALRAPDAANGEPAPPDNSGPSLVTAIQEQLGLRLESQKSAADVFVVQSAAPPTEN